MSDKKNNSEESQSVQPRPGWVMRALGLKRGKGRFFRVVPNRWGWCLSILVVVLICFVGFVEYSMQPEFCRSCHVMEPYFQAWHESTHKDVNCADCHFEPGLKSTLRGKFEATSQAVKFITGTYGSKPHAEIRDGSCLRDGCHERRLLEGNVNWTIKTQRNHDLTIRFNHKPHLKTLRRGKQLRCVSCHSQMVQGKHIVVTLDTCFLCHFKGLKHGRDDETLAGCRSCHEAPKKEIRLAIGLFDHQSYLDRGVTCENCHSDTVYGDGAVPKQMCWSCHNKPASIKRYGDTSFIHKTHVTDHKVECSNCHVQIVHHLDARNEQKASLLSSDRGAGDSSMCGQCHQMSHNGPLELYKGVGGRGVPDMPSPMYRSQVDCIACHQKQKNVAEIAEVVGQTYVAAQRRCDYCHGNTYEGRLDEWKGTIVDHLERAKAIRLTAGIWMEENQLEAMKELEYRRLLDDADHNIRLVELGYGVHNVTYATAVLNVAIKNCEQIVGAVEEVEEIESDQIQSPGDDQASADGGGIESGDQQKRAIGEIAQ